MQNSRARPRSSSKNDFRGTVLSLPEDMAKESYLARLPRIAQKRGDTSKGEIEVITNRKAVKRIKAECGAELEGSALGKGGKRIGILLEDNPGGTRWKRK